MPESFEYAQNGGRKYLFHNLGNGSFEEVSQKTWYRYNDRWALAAVAADLTRHAVTRISLSQTTTASLNSTSTMASNFARSENKLALVSRRRAG